MGMKRYKLRILPLFEDDLNKMVDHIAFELKNPTAAINLVNDIEKAINDRLTCAESFESYPSNVEREYPYYRIKVKNYLIFYVVIDDVMEVRRVIYSRRNITEII